MTENQEPTPIAPARRRRWLMPLVFVGVLGVGVSAGFALAERGDNPTLWMDQRMSHGSTTGPHQMTPDMWPHMATDWEHHDGSHAPMNGPMMRGG
jgi:hypothetical protein